MKKFYLMTLVAISIVISGCDNQSKQQELEKQKQEDSIRIAENVKKELAEKEAQERAEREKQEAEERAEREKQEAEERAEREKQEAEEQTKSIDKFVGTYWLDFGIQEGRFHNNPIVVLEDGRCLIIYETVSGSKDAQILGNIQYLSDGAFTIKGRNSSFGPSLPYNYIDAEGNKHKYAISEKSYHWHNYDQPVFDIDEMRVYRKKSEYIDRDVATAYYADIKSKTSSTSLTQ